jgi:signal transduction histidine kinase
LPSEDFHDVERQAERVAEKMRQVSHELNAARREILQSERLAAVGELAAGVAHEIRNPLTSVKLLLQHASRNPTEPRLDDAKLALILDEIGRIESTVQGLLDFSRPPRLNRVAHDLRLTLRRAMTLVEARAHQHNIQIVMAILREPLIVEGDEELLHQVFVNLLINAVEAMPNGGELFIETSIEPCRIVQDALDPSDFRDPRVVRVVIRDSGAGIPDAVMSRLFEPFATTKERGTGLGLAISRRILEIHNATIHASNSNQGGAQFTVSIPMAAADDSTTLLSNSFARV